MTRTAGQFTVKDILNLEISPALGCTEPSAIALATAAARSLIGDEPVSGIDVWMDMNLYKNGFAVSIPGTKGEAGLDLAAALGAAGGNPMLRLQVLDSVDDPALIKAREWIEKGIVKVNLDTNVRGLYVRAVVRGGGAEVETVIREVHDNIVSLKKDGVEIDDHPLLAKQRMEGKSVSKLEKWLGGLSMEEMLCLLDDLDEDDLAFMEEGARTNVKLAEYGLKFGPGLGIGQTLERLYREGLIQKDLILAARIMTSAAADARMSGVKLPAMSSAGSGNHGLTAILPIWAVREYLPAVTHKQVLESIALSHIITAYLKSHTGRLSAVCGCSVAAGAGATAGVAFLMGGNNRHISAAIINLIEDLAGVICDGAKSGCALKLATAAGAAVQAALFALHGVRASHTDGIIGISMEKTAGNVGKLSTEGMIEADRTILRILVDKHLS